MPMLCLAYLPSVSPVLFVLSAENRIILIIGSLTISKTFMVEYYDERVNIPYTDDLTLYQPKGCKECNDVGYRGRIGLYELLLGDRPMKIQIIDRCLVDDLREVAVKGGMTTLLQDGIHNTFLGRTDMKQVLSVCSR